MAWPHAMADGLQVRKLKAHHVTGHAPTRAAAESALRGLGAEALGMSPQAWLVVRRVACGGHREALLDALAHQRREAARPWHEEVAVDCPAVWFADEAELLACLVRDSLRGSTQQRWWWRSVLAGAEPSAWLAQRVIARGELLVAVALQLMDGRLPVGRTTAPLQAWFAQLSDSQAQQAAQAVAQAYTMASSISTPESVAVGGAPHGAKGQGGTGGGQHIEAVRTFERAALQRLSTTVPELRSSRLRPTARRLLAQVLCLVRAPSWARTAQFALGLQVIDCIETLAPVASPDGEGGIEEEHLAVPQRTAAQAALGGTSPIAASLSEPAPRLNPQRSASRSVRPAARAEPVTAPDESCVPGHAAEERHPFTSKLFDEAPLASLSAFERTSPKPPQLAAHGGRAVQTEFGGLFYLLNAALSLGLYGDFTAPRTPGLALSPWDWLALVGKAWFGKALMRDPLWALLAALAGRRAGDPPGREFNAPTDWYLDPAWLKPWGRVPTLQFHAGKRRMQVLHAAGFVVFDVPRDPLMAPRRQAQQLCRKHAALRGATLARGSGLALPRPGNARWLRCLLSHLQARLALALGRDGVQGLPELVCRHRAQITVFASEVEVALNLADLPLPVRLAGLDRDTGWIPAAGRSLRFHFT